MDNSAENEVKAAQKISHEMAHLRAIFPDEIWEMILNKLSTVTNSTTLQNLSNSSPYFRHLFLDQRAEFLFPSIFPLIAHKSIPPLNPQQAHKVRNHVVRYQCDIPYLNSRLVSITWRNSIDNYFQNHSSHFTSFCEKNLWYSMICRSTQMQTSSMYGNNCPEFLEHFQPSHDSSKNPFISRSISISINVYYIAELQTMLTKYGHHIWYCDISIGNFLARLVDCYKHLKDLVKLMPHLKVLNIIFNHSSFKYKEGSIEVPLCELIAELEQEIEREPFPTFKHLILFKSFDLPSGIFNKVLRHNNHVKMIEANNYNYLIDVQGYDVFSVELPNLTHLTTSFCNSDDILKLGQLKIQGQLQKLHVDHVEQTCNYVRFSEVLKIIEARWSESITDLSLNLPVPPTDDLLLESFNEYPKLKLNFPKLKKLKLVLWNMLPLDIILPAKNTLEYLHVIVNVKIVEGTSRAKQLGEMRKGQGIQFLGSYWVKMGSSNIWRICGKLKLLWVEVNSTHVSGSGKGKPRISNFRQFYCRKDYRKYLKIQQQS